MCRLGAFPPGFKADEAIAIFRKMATFSDQKDGVGAACWSNGKPIVRKWGMPFDEALRMNLPLMEMMPHGGWTIVHLRNKTRGIACLQNTHPFLQGDWLVCHNGTTGSVSDLTRKLMKKRYNIQGDTDSEVGAAAIAEMGPADFHENAGHGAGVYLALNKNGDLWVTKSGGQLEYTTITKDGVFLIASDLRSPWEFNSLRDGWFQFGPDGKLKAKSFVKEGEIFPTSKKDGVSVDQRVPKYVTPPFKTLREEISDRKKEMITGVKRNHPKSTSVEIFNENDYLIEKGDRTNHDLELTPRLKELGYRLDARGNIIGPYNVDPCIHAVEPQSMCPKCNPAIEKCKHNWAKGWCPDCERESDKQVAENSAGRLYCQHGNSLNGPLPCQRCNQSIEEDNEKGRDVLNPSWAELEDYLSIQGT